MEGMHILSMVLCLIVIVGAINWLVYAFDGRRGLVNRVLGHEDEKELTMAEKVVYVLVGVSGILLLVFKVLALTQGGKVSYGMGCNYFDE